jgi:hypothetical protein
MGSSRWLQATTPTRHQIGRPEGRKRGAKGWQLHRCEHHEVERRDPPLAAAQRPYEVNR